MAGQEVNLTEARAQFESQAHLRTEARSCGVKPFERWAWWMQERGGLASAPDASSWWEASAEFRNALTQSQGMSLDESLWTYVGPESVPVHGGAGRVNRVRVDPNDPNRWLACAPSGGLWQTWNSGGQWELLGIDALAPLGVTEVWIDPANSAHLWVGTGDGNGGDTYSIGLLETWDGGQSWAPLELAFEVTQGRRIYSIAEHQVEAGTFLVATDLGVFKTTNGGLTFSLVQPGNARDVLWLNDSTAVAGMENQGLYRSTDAGESWESMALEDTNNSVGRIQLAAESWGENNSRDTVYAVAGHYFQQNFLALWQSTDGGATWTTQSTRTSGPNLLGYTINGIDNGGQAFWDLCLEVDPANASRVLVGGINVWESLDEGVNWSCPIHWQGAGASKYAHADQHDFQFLPNGDVLLANDGGVFRWDGESVVDLSSGLHIAQGYALTASTDKVAHWMLGTQDNGTNFMTPQFESRILDGDGFHCMFDSTTPGRLFASAYYGLLYRSDDEGRTMTNIATFYQSSGPNELGSWHTPFQMHPSVPGRIVAAKKSLHWSDDGGESWSTVGGMGTSRATALALSSSQEDVALVAKNSALHYLASGTDEFVSVPSPSSDYIGDVALSIDSTETWWVACASYEPESQMWRSFDHGNTWHNASQGLPALPVHKVLQLSDQSWVCASELGVHVWNDAEQMWYPYGNGLPLTPVVDLVEDAALNRLMASTYGRGVWAAPLPNAPEFGATVIHVVAPETQCMFSLTGAPQIVGSGREPLSELTYVVVATQEESVVSDSVICTLVEPLHFGEKVELSGYSLTLPSPGLWQVEIQVYRPDGTALGTALSKGFWASGLGHTLTMEWWGDCESVDARWQLQTAESENILLLSEPVSPGDTLSYTWCLTEGCYHVVWQDSGNDGFSGDYCGEAGGFRLFDPFGDILEENLGSDFGNVLVSEFCVDVPWCFADYDGDGQRSVNDLLTLLSDFGCQTDCYADNSWDGFVSIEDLMNVLSVYGTGCQAED